MRTARQEDVPRMREIWRACFGDPDEYIDFFLHRCFVPEHTLLGEADGRVVSQLFLLPASLRAGERRVPIFYLFAAATDPAFRRRGWMERLLRAADTLSVQCGRQAIVLLPGGRTLYSYYEQRGYHTAFYRRTMRVAVDEITAAVDAVPAAAEDPISFLRSFLRERDGVEWDEPFLRYALEEHERFRGRYVCAGGALVCGEHDTATLLAPPDRIADALPLLPSVCDAPQCTLLLPPDAPCGTLCDGGMIRFLGDSVPMRRAFLTFPME